MSDLEDITPSGSVVPVYLDPTPVVPANALPPTPELIAALRRAAYQERSDPLFFKEQRGEVPPGAWRAEIEAIRAEFPAPV